MRHNKIRYLGFSLCMIGMVGPVGHTMAGNYQPHPPAPHAELSPTQPKENFVKRTVGSVTNRLRQTNELIKFVRGKEEQKPPKEPSVGWSQEEKNRIYFGNGIE